MEASVLPNEGAGILLVTPKRQKEKKKEHFALHFMETIIWMLVSAKQLVQDHRGLQGTGRAGSHTTMFLTQLVADPRLLHL